MEQIKIYNDEGNDSMYIILDGKKYYFGREYVSTTYTRRDAEIDALRAELASNAGFELSSPSYKPFSGHYENVGLLPNGNMIVHDELLQYGIVSPSGEVLVDFKYRSIAPLKDDNGEIVHNGCFIVSSADDGIRVRGDFIFYEGIIFENGEELFPLGTEKITDVQYDPKNDVIHCNSRLYWKGLAYATGWSGYDEDLMTITGDTVDEHINQIHEGEHRRKI